MDRKKYTPQFKADAVELVITSKRPIAQCAVDLGINEGTLGNWVRAWREEHPEDETEGRGPVEWAKYQALQAENAELKREIEFLGKSQRLLRREATVTEVFSFIAAEKANYPVAWMCAKLRVSRASFYRWVKPSLPSPRRQRHEMLTGHVTRVYDAARGKAGRDQIWRILRGEGITVAAGTVGAIMRELGLKAVRVRAWKKTTVADPAARTAHIRNHMLDAFGNRQFTADVPGQRLCGDLTYLRTDEGWLYLATVIDLFNGEIIGWRADTHMRTSLVIDALVMARDHGRVDTSGEVVFHSDRGAQYTSGEFQGWCANNGITQSMGEVGVCWDNAVAESFFSHLKTEMFYQRSWRTCLHARTAIMDYIESWYNRRRPHARAGGIPPVAARIAYETRDQSLAA
ncbi:IS3 family transposase [Leucobacter insecticola]|uniref:IS3 family transposase n=1 Tax=Leucobacter insecticola TaxID=2714934 RepID=A0A6G8FIE5_9MICO|nr:IS3 family transposase [Leucobacter insecticola]QIM16220.1 IS3 family transposase [Leucobacter insecticola]